VAPSPIYPIMRRSNTHSLFSVALFLLVSLVISSSLIGAQSLEIRVSEGVLRKKAIKTVTPSFPDAARKKGAQGVAVAELYANEKGEVIKVKILEAPDASIEEAISEALSQWKLTPTTIKGVPARVRGKLIFYFMIDGDNAWVEEPGAGTKKTE